MTALSLRDSPISQMAGFNLGLFGFVFFSNTFLVWPLRRNLLADLEKCFKS